MDNIAHTLVGAALGRAISDRRLRYAGVIGAIAANAPDIAEPLLGVPTAGPDYLALHRGITHSLLGAAVQIAAITPLAWAISRFLTGGRLTGLPLARSLTLCITAAVLSHLYMDWQGSYGLRPFLPASNRWYYGDLIAIVDVFFWIVPLIGLAWGAERHWLPALAYGIPLAAAATLPLMAFRLFDGFPAIAPAVAIGSVLLILVGVAGWMRYWFGPVARRAGAATALGALAAYVLVSAGAGVPEKLEIRRAARARFGEHAQWAALTVPGRPLTWQAIYANRDTVAGETWAVPRHVEEPFVLQALATPPGRAMTQFARFLTAEVDSGGEGISVYLRDARYARGGREGWGIVPVTIKSSLPTSRPLPGDRPTGAVEWDSVVPRGRDDQRGSGAPPERR